MRTGILHFTYSGKEYYAIILNILEEKDIKLSNYYEAIAGECLTTAMGMEPRIKETKGKGSHPFNIWLEVDGVEKFRITSFDPK